MAARACVWPLFDAARQIVRARIEWSRAKYAVTLWRYFMGRWVARRHAKRDAEAAAAAAAARGRDDDVCGCDDSNPRDEVLSGDLFGGAATSTPMMRRSNSSRHRVVGRVHGSPSPLAVSSGGRPRGMPRSVSLGDDSSPSTATTTPNRVPAGVAVSPSPSSSITTRLHTPVSMPVSPSPSPSPAPSPLVHTGSSTRVGSARNRTATSPSTSLSTSSLRSPSQSQGPSQSEGQHAEHAARATGGSRHLPPRGVHHHHGGAALLAPPPRHPTAAPRSNHSPQVSDGDDESADVNPTGIVAARRRHSPQKHAQHDERQCHVDRFEVSQDSAAALVSGE